MPSLSDRLKALGITLGAENLPSRPARPTPTALEEIIPGAWHHLREGEVFICEERYMATHRQGEYPLRSDTPPTILAQWAGDERLVHFAPEEFLFLDLETSSLYGGGGEYAFLIGAGRFEGDEFILRQFFLHDPAQEAAQLASFEAWSAPCRALVTFNGKSFDLPFLKGRYTRHHWPFPLQGMAHLDLLHLARRLWRERLPSRTLGDLEEHILRFRRDQRDIPGWLVAERYAEFLHTGDPEPLIGVFYHNAMDVLSMAALLHHVTRLLHAPLDRPETDHLDLLAIARLHAELGDQATAEHIYAHVLESCRLPEAYHATALMALAALYKRQKRYEAALPLWEAAAAGGDIGAHIELAKVCEHRHKDIPLAHTWTRQAIALLDGKATAGQRARWLPELEHRLARLERKLATDNR